MSATTDIKRQNFNITPEQEAEIAALQADFAAPTAKDTILRAVRLASVLAREIKGGKRLGLIDRKSGDITEVLLPELEAVGTDSWTFLVARPHSWKKQLFIKGRRVTAANIWLDMRVNNMSREEAAENWDLPVEAIAEIEAYCEQNRELLRMEADEERMFLEAAGVTLTP